LFKVKPLARRAYAPEGKAKILTAPLGGQAAEAPYIEVFRGLKSEPDAEIGEKGHLWMGTNSQYAPAFHRHSVFSRHYFH